MVMLDSCFISVITITLPCILLLVLCNKLTSHVSFPLSFALFSMLTRFFFVNLPLNIYYSPLFFRKANLYTSALKLKLLKPGIVKTKYILTSYCCFLWWDWWFCQSWPAFIIHGTFFLSKRTVPAYPHPSVSNPFSCTMAIPGCQPR